MAKIILTEAQFKDYTRMLLKEERKAQFTDKVIREVLSEMDVYNRRNANVPE